MHISIDFAPHIAVGWIILIAALAAGLTGYALWRRARGAIARAGAFAIALVVLANPLIVRETREPLPDIVALVVDHSFSMTLDHRRAQADKAADEIAGRIAHDKTLDLRRAEVTSPLNEDSGTRLIAGLASALADAPSDRIAGAIAITDGEVHDAATTPAPHAPFHALIAGRHDERDRKLTVVSAARYAIVGQTADVVIRVDDYGAPAGGAAQVGLRIGGVDVGSRFVPAGRNLTLRVPVAHEGENVLEVEARPGPAE